MIETINHLWRKRMIYLAKLYYKFISFQIDFTIAIYLMVLLGYLGYYYISRIDNLPTLIEKSHYEAILVLFISILILTGKQKGYLKMADEVFLTPLNKYGKEFVRYSALFSIASSIIAWSIGWGFIYRFILKDSYGINLFIYMWLLGILVKLTVINVKFIIYHKTVAKNRFYKNLVITCILFVIIFIGVHYMLQGENDNIPLLLSIGFLPAVIASFYCKKKTTIRWNDWINDDINARARNFSFLLGKAPYERHNPGRGKASRFVKDNKMEKAFSFILKDSVKHKEGEESKEEEASVNNGKSILNPKGALFLLYTRTLLRGKGNKAIFLQFLSLMMAINYFIGAAIYTLIINVFFIFLVADFSVSLWNTFKLDVWLKIHPFSLKDKGFAATIIPMIVVVPVAVLTALLQPIFSDGVIHPITDGILLVAWGVLIVYIRGSVQLIKLR